MPLFRRKKVEEAPNVPPVRAPYSSHYSQFEDRTPESLLEFSQSVGNGPPQWVEAGLGDSTSGTDAFLSEFGGTSDRFRTTRGRSFSRYYSHRLRTEYPVLQTATGAAVVNSYANSLSGLRSMVVDSNGREVEKPPWMVTPLPANPSYSFRKLIRSIVYSLLLDGNAFVLVHRNPMKEVVGLRLLDPTTCHPFGDLSEPEFAVWDGGAFATLKVDGGYTPSNSSSSRGKSYAGRYSPNDMLHFSINVPPESLRGCSPFMLADSAVTTQIHNQDFIERQFIEGSHQQVIASFKDTTTARPVNGKPMSDEDYTRFVKNLADQIQSQQKFAMVSIPLDYQMVGVNPQEADMINARMQGRDEISIASNVPPMIALNNREGAVSYASAGAQMSWFASQSLDPMRRDIQDEFTRLCPAGCEFVMDIRDLQVGDPKTEAEVDRINLDSGLYYVNELRLQKGMEPIPDPEFDVPHRNTGGVSAGTEDAASIEEEELEDTESENEDEE